MRGAAILCLVFSLLVTVGLFAAGASEPVTLLIDAGQPVASVTPSEALGAGIDGRRKGDTDRTFNPAALKELSGASFYRLSYRLRTELGAQVWHWNEEGTWSDPEHAQGYWTSSDSSEKPILVSNGYRLPRRGNTTDQANNDGYSRLSDGDTQSFWKSNPYLDAHFTGEDNALYPQWVLVNFKKSTAIQTLRILWGEPYAVDYEVQYWDGEWSEYYNDLTQGRWRTFPKGQITGGAGGDVLLRLGDTPVQANCIRILLKRGSGTAPAGSTDIRDHLGFAIRELYAEGLDDKGNLTDLMVHAPDGKQQTEIVTSSTDPWHRAMDRDEDVEQPGFDRVMGSALARSRPMLVPTGLLYDTPDNAAAEIRFLKSRGYDIRQVELGEEPDGQNIAPEHYGALFVQFADAIHKANPALVVGGPGFQSEVNGWNSIPDNDGKTSWMGQFLAYLKSRKRSQDFGFFSFEWYPFDDLCKEAPHKQLTRHPELIADTIKRLEEDGVPRDIPWVITEYGYSSFAGQREAELPAALLNAEIVAQYLMAGVKTAYLYGVEPNIPIKELDACETWGNLMALEIGPDGHVRWRLPTYYGAKLVTEEWFGAPDAVHTLHKVRIQSSKDGENNALAAYAVHRPDNRWALLVLNKSPVRAQTITASFEEGRVAQDPWMGPHEILQYSPRQYRWLPGREKGRPAFSHPPRQRQTGIGVPLSLRLPPMSMTIVRAPRTEGAVVIAAAMEGSELKKIVSRKDGRVRHRRPVSWQGCPFP